MTRRGGSLSVLLALTCLATACSTEPVDPCDGLVKSVGTAGADKLEGGAAGECLLVLAGNDVVVGGIGADVLHGGPGSDMVSGDLGDDTFLVELGDEMDMIVDEGGADTIRFDGQIALDSISISQDRDSISIQIEQDDRWAYLMVVDSDEKTIESYVLPDGETISREAFLTQFPTNALAYDDFMQDVIAKATVELEEDDGDSALFIAAESSMKLFESQNLCVRPQMYPRPDETGKVNGPFRPEEYFVIFYGPPEGEQAEQQRRQFEALAIAGVMDSEPALSSDGEAGCRYELTMDGWAYADNQGCIHYGQLELQKVVSFRPTGRRSADAEHHQIEAQVKASDVALWAREEAVRQAFPGIDENIVGKTIMIAAYKQGDEWFGSTKTLQLEKVLQPPRTSVPSNRELLEIDHISNVGTLGESNLCLPLPLLGEGRYDEGGSPYVTYSRHLTSPNSSYDRSKEYLDMLVEVGAAASSITTRTNSKNQPFKALEYRFSENIAIEETSRAGACMPVVSLAFDIIHARSKTANTVTLRGVETAMPLYPWVSNPKFLAHHADVAQMLRGPQPLTADITVAEGQPLKMRYLGRFN